MSEFIDQPALAENSAAQPDVSQQRTGSRVGKRFLAVLSLTAAFGAASSATAQSVDLNPGYESADCATCVLGPDQTPPQPHLAIGMEDDAVVASANPSLIETATNQARDLGANVMRDIIYPSYVSSHTLAKYDTAVKQEIHKGFYVTETLACNKVNWTDQKVYNFVTTVVKHEDALGVREYSLCNEPNFTKAGWLKPMPHKTLAQTYCDLYQVGYNAVHTQARKDGVEDRVVSFEVSSEAKPLQFMKQVLNCAPMKTDMVAYHPYTLTSSPFEPCDLSGDVGFACLPVIEKFIQSEYDAGKLETPDGQKPPLGLSEFAYQVENSNSTATPAHGKRRKKGQAHNQSTTRYLPDKVRQQDYSQDLKIACADPNVVRLGFYGLDSLPGAKGTWHSPLFTQSGEPYGSALVIQSFADSHPACVR